jgi:adenine-specific DNA-methyltransferase
MYPRLFLARNLLKEDGVIFVSIDDNEVKNLRALMDEVFGEDNFVANLVWQKSKKGDSKLISRTHEYVVVFGKNIQSIISQGNWRIGKEGVDSVLTHYDSLIKQYPKDHNSISDEMRKWFKKIPDDDPRKQHQHYRWSDDRGLYFAADFAGPDDGRESRPRYDIIHPITNKPCKKPSTGWRWDEERTKKALMAKPPLIHFGIDETTIPCRKVYLKDTNSEPFFSVFYRDGRAGTLEVEKLLGKGLFDFPKNTDVIQGFSSLIGDEEAIILDFFAGSGTTAQAVLELNKEDGGNRKFIMVQLPEKTGRDDYPTITDITLERTRRVIKKLNDADNGSLNLNGTPDRGFKAFTLRSSNFKVWDSNAEGKTSEDLEEQLTLFAHNLDVAEADEQGILFEIFLKSGLLLTAKVQTLELHQKVYAVEYKRLYICLAQPIESETLLNVLEAKPEKFVYLDEAFKGNDQLKTNTLLQVRHAGISFYTV